MDELRPVSITRNYLKFAEGSVLFEAGDTKVICAATVEDKVPPFLAGTGKGWLTAEYAMLPRSVKRRVQRESSTGKVRDTLNTAAHRASLRAGFDLSPGRGPRRRTSSADAGTGPRRLGAFWQIDMFLS